MLGGRAVTRKSSGVLTSKRDYDGDQICTKEQGKNSYFTG
jgi:hypothetical protein